jgi:hypothetical protein
VSDPGIDRRFLLLVRGIVTVHTFEQVIGAQVTRVVGITETRPARGVDEDDGWKPHASAYRASDLLDLGDALEGVGIIVELPPLDSATRTCSSWKQRNLSLASKLLARFSTVES